jgi:hypothetical protein
LRTIINILFTQLKSSDDFDQRDVLYWSSVLEVGYNVGVCCMTYSENIDSGSLSVSFA